MYLDLVRSIALIYQYLEELVKVSGMIEILGEKQDLKIGKSFLFSVTECTGNMMINDQH